MAMKPTKEKKKKQRRPPPRAAPCPTGGGTGGTPGRAPQDPCAINCATTSHWLFTAWLPECHKLAK